MIVVSRIDMTQSAATHTAEVALFTEFVRDNQWAGYGDAPHNGRKVVAYEGTEAVRTPPIPSSSPGPGNDSMDMSPLPHKVPFALGTRIYLTSPTSDVIPPKETKVDAHSVVQEVLADASGQAMSFE